MSNKTEIIAVILVTDTEDAYCFREKSNGVNIWVPKKFVHDVTYLNPPYKKSTMHPVEVEIEEWIAKEKGLI